MLETLVTHVRRNVVGYIALFVALGGTTYAANGGNFILGQTNSATSSTQLSAGSAGAALKVTNPGSGRGIAGYSNTGQGIYGHSNSTAGLVGESANFDGVFGTSKASGAGVSGHNDTSGGWGIFGGAGGGIGVGGYSNSGPGVQGSSTSGFAMQAIGHATQDRASGGWAKAMAYVDPAQTSDPIRACFNSQLAASQATANDCGMTYTPVASTVYDINFGFRVDDRFPVVSAWGGVINVLPQTQTTLRVANSIANQGFYIVVF
jgi:hypothetical protein